MARGEGFRVSAGFGPIRFIKGIPGWAILLILVLTILSCCGCYGIGASI